MKLPKEKSAAAARHAKRRLENPLTEAQTLVTRESLKTRF